MLACAHLHTHTHINLRKSHTHKHNITTPLSAYHSYHSYHSQRFRLSKYLLLYSFWVHAFSCFCLSLSSFRFFYFVYDHFLNVSDCYSLQRKRQTNSKAEHKEKKKQRTNKHTRKHMNTHSPATQQPKTCVQVCVRVQRIKQKSLHSTLCNERSNEIN